MSFCYAITSGKGGTGKSTVSVGLGLAFAQMGKKTLLVDMDEGLRCLDLMLGVEKNLVFDLADIFKGKEIEDAVYDTPINENLFLIPAPAVTGNIEPLLFKDFAEKLTSLYDIVIFDFPAGVDFTLYEYLPKNTTLLAVCNPDPVSVRDAAAVCEFISIKNEKTKLIINKFVYKTLHKGLFSNIDDIIDESGFSLIGIVPQSEELVFFQIKHKLKKHGRALKAFKRIANRLLGCSYALPKPKKI